MSSTFRQALALYGFIVVGAFLMFAPWTSIWERAVLALVPTQAAGFFLLGWVRGAVMGLGALDLLVAAQVVGELWRDLGREGGQHEGGQHVEREDREEAARRDPPGSAAAGRSTRQRWLPGSR